MADSPRPMPHDLDAERAVLGAVLVNNDLYGTAASVVVPGTFFRRAHGQCWTAICALQDRNEPADILTLRAELERRGELEDVGGPAYLASLIDGVPKSTNVEYYAAMVRDKAALRELATIGHRLTEAASVGADEPAVVLGAVTAQIEATRSRIAGVSAGHVAHDQRVADELDRQRAQRDARRRLDAEDRGPVEIPPALSLRDRLAVPRPLIQPRIAGFLPVGTRAMLAAQFKAGKTTLVGNTIRSLVDGDAFLGQHDVIPIHGALALIDTEMGAQLWDWLGAQQIRHDDRVVPFPLRGQVASLNLIDRDIRRQWADRLREAGASFVVLDCLRPVLDALGLDEHRDAGRFLVAFDALLAEAGVSEALVVQHMGHTAERARGDSRLRDWPDVEWRLVRQDDDPASARYISAYGRDVDIPEAALHFEKDGRRLTIGPGSRRDAKAAEALEDVLAVLDDGPLSGRAIEAACTAAGSTQSRDTIRLGVALGIRLGDITIETGSRRAILHHKAASARVRGSARPVRETTESECAAAYIAAHTRTLDPGGVSAPEVLAFDARPFLDADGRPSRRPA